MIWIAIAFGIAIGLPVGFYGLRAGSQIVRKPNIVIFSFCSLRKNEIDPETTPNLLKVFDHGFDFKNAFSRYGWTNPSLYLFEAIRPEFFKQYNYDLIGTEGSGMLFRIPSEFVQVGNANFTAEQFVHNYRAPMDLFRFNLFLPRVNPFFVYVHVKYMHYPYIDTLNPDVHWNKFLSSEEKARVMEVLTDTSTKKALPLKLILTGDPKYTGGKKGSRVEFNALYSFFSSPQVTSTLSGSSTGNRHFSCFSVPTLEP